MSVSQASEALLAGTSKDVSTPALLVLEDGTSFVGISCGAQGEVFGEVCFNTSEEGYLEILTDPSYSGQIVCMTYPQIGNYGVSEDDVQRGSIAARGMIVRDMCRTPSSWRCQESMPDLMKRSGVVCIEGVDTRSLVRHLRDAGSMRGAISTVDLDPSSLLEKVRASAGLVGENLVKDVSRPGQDDMPNTPDAHIFAVGKAPSSRYEVVAYDCGAKNSILQCMEREGMHITRVPWDAPAEKVLAMAPDGVFLSNGPGDPEAVGATIEEVGKLIGKVPIFGICLGHQMLGLAAGGEATKLKFGHRGGNHPVLNLLTGRVEVTSQNHGFAIGFNTLGSLIPEESGGISENFDDLREWIDLGIAPVVMNDRFGRVRLTHVSLNDGTLEGAQFLDVPAFSVQYHPEASPGPVDSRYLFSAFARLMDGESDALDMDIAKMRTASWVFGGEGDAEAA